VSVCLFTSGVTSTCLLCSCSVFFCWVLRIWFSIYIVLTWKLMLLLQLSAWQANSNGFLETKKENLNKKNRHFQCKYINIYWLQCEMWCIWWAWKLNLLHLHFLFILCLFITRIFQVGFEKIVLCDVLLTFSNGFQNLSDLIIFLTIRGAFLIHKTDQPTLKKTWSTTSPSAKTHVCECVGLCGGVIILLLLFIHYCHIPVVN